MPNQTVIKQWVDALRSGDYKQTTGYLHRIDADYETPAGMCCLGVLCDLAVKADVVQAHAIGGGLMQYGNETHVLPRVVKEWAGLEFDNPYVDHVVDYDGVPEPAHDPLSLLNDDFGLGFEAIADAIEATYLAKSDAGQPA
jgi:hypothetical protein